MKKRFICKYRKNKNHSLILKAEIMTSNDLRKQEKNVEVCLIINRESFLKVTSLYIKLILKLPDENWMQVANGVYYQNKDEAEIKVLNFYEDYFREQEIKEKKKSESRAGWRNASKVSSINN